MCTAHAYVPNSDPLTAINRALDVLRRNSSFHAATSPTLSSIDNSAMRIGDAAVGLLSRMLRSPKFRKRTQHIVVGPRGVCERGSTAVRPVDVAWVSDIM